MHQALPCSRYEFLIKSLNEILGTTEECEFGFFEDIDLEKTDTIRSKTRFFQNVLNLKKLTTSYPLTL